MRVVTFKLDERLLKELDNVLKNGITRSDAVRRAIIDMLRELTLFMYGIRKVIIA